MISQTANRSHEISIAEIRGDGFSVSADGDAEKNEKRERARLDDRQRCLNELTFLDTAKVDPGENPDCDECNESLRGETNLNEPAGSRDIELREPAETVGRDRRPQNAEESAECYCDCRNRSGLNDDEQSPSIQKTHERSHGFAEKYVLATSSRIHRSELAVCKSAEDRDDAGGEP